MVPTTGERVQFSLNKNENHNIIAWVDGSADNRNAINAKSGCACWLGDNWFYSLTAPFTDIKLMKDIVHKLNGNFSSTDM